MFDIAFSEMLVIAIVALLVIGPEKLPKVARTAGMLLGRLQRYVAGVKADIDRELQYNDLQKLQQEIKQSTQRIQAEATSLKAELDAVAQDLNEVREAAATAQANTPPISPKQETS